MKRILSLIIAAVMVLCSIPFTAVAIEDQNTVKRYTVLVLDTSGKSDFITKDGDVIYSADAALDYVQRASSRFLDNISNAPGENYVAIVSYRDDAETVSGFTADFDTLKKEIDDLSASGDTRSVASGIEAAGELLEQIDVANARKNVVLFTTGMTNAGEYNYEGVYDETTVGSNWKRSNTQVHLYAYANAAIAKADALKAGGVSVYTIGLFQTMDNMPENGQSIIDLFRLTANNLATSDDYYYPIENPDELEFKFGDVIDDIINPKYELTFTYNSTEDYTATCYYTNDYFSKSAYEYDASLATMTLSFAMSAFGSEAGGYDDYTDKSKNARKLLQDIGVKAEDIEYNDWFTKKPTTDSIGVIAGNMPISVNGENYTLIALAVRGAGYEQEWASNFTVGTEGLHTGFNEAKEQVLDFLKNYIANRKISGDVKLWITGYSRAAATANLLAGAIDDGVLLSENITYENDDVYAYCFETPAGALTSQVKGQSKYYNIFNIINSSDPVPYVAPAALGFGRYGVDKYLPSAESSANYATLKHNMLKIYNGLDSTDEYVVDNFQMKKLALKNWLPGGEKISFIQDDKKNNFSQGVFLSNYVTILSKEFFKSRKNYVKKYQDEIREVCSVMFGCTPEQSKVMMDSIVAQATENWGSLVWSYVWNVGINPWGSEAKALQMISDWLKVAVDEAGITDYDEATLDSAGKSLGDLVLALVSSHPNYFTTAVMNGGGLAAAHFPELCFSWLASMDANYSEGAKVELNNGGYRIIRINCPVDVTVYDAYGNKVAAIASEAAIDAEDSAYIYGVDEDGQKFVVLPIDAEYEIDIVGREDGKVNISVNEYSAQEGDFTRSINYFDIELGAGEELNSVIPAYSEDELKNGTPDGSDVDYKLADQNDNEIESDSDITGAEEASKYYEITAESSDINKGAVTGSGNRQYGTFAQVEAVVIEGNDFLGWYEGDNKISDEAVLRFCVTENVYLTAKFEKSACTHGTTEIVGAEGATCAKEGYTGDKKCSECGEILENGTKISKPEHTFEWKIDKEPDENGTGLKHEECKCGEKRSENTVIPVVQLQSPETGDKTVTVIAVMFISGICMAGAVYGKKRRNNY